VLLRTSEFPVFAAALITGTPILIIFVSTTPGFEFAGLNLYYEDLVTFILFAQILYRLPTLQRWKNCHFLYLVLGVFTIMVLVSVIRGFMTVPAKTVMNEIRTWLFPISTIYYFTSVKLTRSQLDKIGVVIEWACFIIISITVFRLGLLATGRAIQFSDADTAAVHRPVPAGTAMFMCSSAIYIWYRIAKGKATRVGKFAGAILPFLVIYLQHRSVWSAFGVIIVLVLLFGQELRSRATNFIIICTCGLVALVLLAPDSGPVKSLSESIETSHGENTTLGWREQSWTELLQPAFIGDTMNYVIGKPMGGSLRRRLTFGKNTYFTDVAPHNLYVLLIIRCGFIGLFAFIIFMVVSFFRLFATKDLECKVLSFISAGVMFYWIAYTFDEPQGFYLALGIRLLIGLTDEPKSLGAGSVKSLDENPEQSALPEPAMA